MENIKNLPHEATVEFTISLLLGNSLSLQNTGVPYSTEPAIMKSLLVTRDSDLVSDTVTLTIELELVSWITSVGKPVCRNLDGYLKVNIPPQFVVPDRAEWSCSVPRLASGVKCALISNTLTISQGFSNTIEEGSIIVMLANVMLAYSRRFEILQQFAKRRVSLPAPTSQPTELKPQMQILD
jgi:hypothetical protein